MTFLLAALLIHSWYPNNCCGTNHCRPVACTSIASNPDGSIDWTGLHFEPGQVSASHDAMCHVCVIYNEHTHGRWPVCAFIATTT